MEVDVLDKTMPEAVIRQYTKGDIPGLIDILIREVPKLPHYRHITPAADRIAFLLNNNIGNAYLRCSVLDLNGKIIGLLIGYASRSLLSWDYIANDIFMWVDEDHVSLKHANLLLRDYHTWGKLRGCAEVIASQTSGFKREEMKMLLERHGFEDVGAIFRYIKE